MVLPVPAPVTIRHKVVLVPCRIGAQTYRLHSGREKGKGVEEDAELLVARRDIAVPELRMKDQTMFCPVGIQGLIGSVSLVREECILFLRLDERGIHIERRDVMRVSPLNRGNEVSVDTFKGRQKSCQRGDYGLALVGRVVLMEGGEIPEDSGGRRD